MWFTCVCLDQNFKVSQSLCWCCFLALQWTLPSTKAQRIAGPPLPHPTCHKRKRMKKAQKPFQKQKPKACTCPTLLVWSRYIFFLCSKLSQGWISQTSVLGGGDWLKTYWQVPCRMRSSVWAVCNPSEAFKQRRPDDSQKNPFKSFSGCIGSMLCGAPPILGLIGWTMVLVT